MDDDVVLAADGEKILGIGKVTGAYQYKINDTHNAPHRRPVRWLEMQTWKLPQTEGLLTCPDSDCCSSDRPP